MPSLARLCALACLVLACARAEPDGPPPQKARLPDSDRTYLDYVTRAPEFQPVRRIRR